MLDYQARGSLPPKHHLQFPRGDGAGVYYEECFTRQGFDGAYSILYHAHPTTDDVALAPSSRGWAQPVPVPPSDGLLKRRLFLSHSAPAGGALLDAVVPVLFNKDLTVCVARPTASDDAYFSNGDGDVLAYVYEGRGRLESSFGWLPFTAGDYVWIPKGVLHRWHFESADNHLLYLESLQELRIPKQFRGPTGQLKMEAPYCHRDFVRPEGNAWTPGEGEGQRYTVVYKRRGVFCERVLPHHPLDVVGWDGSLYPVAFAIEKYQPKTGLVHLPPTSHMTFAAEGFVVCSFVPRVVDFHPQSVPCPYPHTSVDCDELILYVRGNFTSRKGVGPGALSLHPAGVPHGPHPGAYERSFGATRTDELAVMVDTFAPLDATANAWQLESRDYHSSWA